MLTNIFDTHAHYDDEAFQEDRAEVLGTTLPEGGVVRVVDCAVDLLSSVRVLDLAHEYDYVYAALGIHPEQAGEERKGDLDMIVELLEKEDKAVAVGEIGLDYYWEENAPRDTQVDLFSRQLALSKDLGLPVIIHDREAHQDCLEVVKAHPNVKGAAVLSSRGSIITNSLKRIGIDNIKTICLDMTTDNIAAMMDGWLDFLVGQRPGLQGFLAVETLLKSIICGGHPEVENYMPLDIITRENIAFYKEYVVQNSTGGGGN
jgi:hypothetical protein